MVRHRGHQRRTWRSGNRHAVAARGRPIFWLPACRPVGALIDTACGFAAATVVGRVLASHYSVNCLRPAVGERFVAEARVVKPGKSQVFTTCELYAQAGGSEKLAATGETLLLVVADEVV